ncbi:hypothetical protein SAMN04487943_1165 [Gracilibacillus orientalis]|uniref:Cthe-2314-like HEPN domain-containing protein n=1 Tax=Gracilibacillus orientalis TaxID=334253 RepID=A0A1I4QEQ1_9BACI|nr:hypothetical protein [Gracilibacillus orientalis]SFM38120.1 hypothetical protein SAMN04487943_1165 [Gracilibacillus orientalis]
MIINTNWFSIFANIQLDYFSEYNDRLESFLDSKKNNIEESFNDRIQALKLQNAEQKNKLFEMHYEDEYHSFNKEFPTILRTSLFNTIYSHLEVELHNLCKRFENDKSIKVNDLNHRGIERSKVYLTKVCNIDFPSNTNEWRLIKNYQTIRNKLTHEGYEFTVDKDNKKLVTAIQNVVGVNMVDRRLYYEVTFDESFCYIFLSILYNFFYQIAEILPNEK